ncbi:hypothetical protein Acsp03_42500 [Actinomadura sp. NBRC 104412]|nr:hypothetical protein Acsp03_42500 [Actinomadura sp. NBRC 104412]
MAVRGTARAAAGRTVVLVATGAARPARVVLVRAVVGRTVSAVGGMTADPTGPSGIRMSARARVGRSPAPVDGMELPLEARVDGVPQAVPRELGDSSGGPKEARPVAASRAAVAGPVGTVRPALREMTGFAGTTAQDAAMSALPRAARRGATAVPSAISPLVGTTGGALRTATSVRNGRVAMTGRHGVIDRAVTTVLEADAASRVAVTSVTARAAPGSSKGVAASVPMAPRPRGAVRASRRRNGPRRSTTSRCCPMM